MRTKSIVTISVAAAVMIYGASAFAAVDKNFGTGTVTFRGTILDAPCDIATGDDKLDVDFGEISYKSLKKADTPDDAHAKNFTIRLQNCDFDKPGSGLGHENDNPKGLMSKVMVSFSGGQTTGDKKVFLSTNPDNPSLGVQLTNTKGDIITPHVPADYTGENEIQLRAGVINELTYTAKLINVGTEGSVIPGHFTIPVNYTLKYQ